MKKNSFRSNKKYFHVVLDYQTSGLFKNLDWLFIQKKIYQSAKNHEIEVQVLVMMDTHIHLIIATFTNKEHFFCEEIQKAITSTSGLHNLCEPIMNFSQYLNTYKYVYRNPVEVNLVEKVENYPYSSLQALLGKSVSHCQVVDQLNLIQNPIHILKWLNTDMNYKISQMKLLRQASSLLI